MVYYGDLVPSKSPTRSLSELLSFKIRPDPIPTFSERHSEGNPD